MGHDVACGQDLGHAGGGQSERGELALRILELDYLGKVGVYQNLGDLWHPDKTAPNQIGEIVEFAVAILVAGDFEKFGARVRRVAYHRWGPHVGVKGGGAKSLANAVLKNRQQLVIGSRGCPIESNETFSIHGMNIGKDPIFTEAGAQTALQPESQVGSPQRKWKRL